MDFWKLGIFFTPPPLFHATKMLVQILPASLGDKGAETLLFLPTARGNWLRGWRAVTVKCAISRSPAAPSSAAMKQFEAKLAETQAQLQDLSFIRVVDLLHESPDPSAEYRKIMDLGGQNMEPLRRVFEHYSSLRISEAKPTPGAMSPEAFHALLQDCGLGDQVPQVAPSHILGLGVCLLWKWICRCIACRDVFKRLTTTGGGGTPPGPPPPWTQISYWEMLIWAIFGTQTFGFQTPSPFLSCMYPFGILSVGAAAWMPPPCRAWGDEPGSKGVEYQERSATIVLRQGTPSGSPHQQALFRLWGLSTPQDNQWPHLLLLLILLSVEPHSACVSACLCGDCCCVLVRVAGSLSRTLSVSFPLPLSVSLSLSPSLLLPPPLSLPPLSLSLSLSLSPSLPPSLFLCLSLPSSMGQGTGQQGAAAHQDRVLAAQRHK